MNCKVNIYLTRDRLYLLIFMFAKYSKFYKICNRWVYSYSIYVNKSYKFSFCLFKL